jgi:hypothetical protein
MTAEVEGPAPPGDRPENQVATKALDTATLPPEPRYDPLCGRCGGPAGPEGAWCDNCIRERKEHTRQLDLAGREWSE